ncbi:hypothetical protein F5876DRAFT_79696 [Lentinula aff. lateritia]|uniref:Uncharacterized protein n=1 Tax=Lentinula aff. lateritia TaxID=2804960 RepID=A0ACC1TRU1_9AGAR|nr:hypothetical protein F5876DRAFT_79696 [Lentinula aff. lateritia]
MLSISSRSALSQSQTFFSIWRRLSSTQPIFSPSHDTLPPQTTRHLDLSIGQIPFTSISDLRINDSHPPINLLPRFDLGLLPSPSGYIYYHTPQGRPSICSELRFRTIDEENGGTRDWTMPNKIPWSLPLYRIVKNPVLSPLKDLLVQDEILTPTFIEHCNRVFPEDFATVAPNRVIYGLRQSFPIHMCRNKTTLWIVGEDKVLDLNIGSAWLGYPHTRQKNHRGTAMAELDYLSGRGYILRVVKEPPLASPHNQRSIRVGRNRGLQCYSLTAPDYLPVLEELVGR